MKRTKEYWINLAKAAGIRALKTCSQTFVATIGTAAELQEGNWVLVASASVLAGGDLPAARTAGPPGVNNRTSGNAGGKTGNIY